MGACGWAPHNKATVTGPEAKTIINASRRLVALLWGGACEVPRESMPLAPQRAKGSASSARGNLGRSRQGGVRRWYSTPQGAGPPIRHKPRARPGRTTRNTRGRLEGGLGLIKKVFEGCVATHVFRRVPQGNAVLPLRFEHVLILGVAAQVSRRVLEPRRFA